MGQITIAWEYLTGCCVATDAANRQRAEWPPHPARVFMALAAAWFETGRDAAEGAVLKWLETLSDPELLLPQSDHVFARSVVDVYVPVNDRRARPSKALLQSVPSLTRDRQPRTFPTTWVGNTICYARWSDTDVLEQHSAALSQLCSKVTRIGHASSLVRMWVADEPPDEEDGAQLWKPADAVAELLVRRISSGFLDLLVKLYGEHDRVRHVQLVEEIEVLKTRKKATKGKGAADKRAQIDEQISEQIAELGVINPRPPIRPTIGLWRGYRRVKPTASPAAAHSHFDTELLILTQQEGPRLPLEATLNVMQALRGTVMAHCGMQPAPEWISGHQKNGTPSSREDGHLALVPLPFVGHEHADGHLLGLALIFPRSIDRRERGTCIGPLLLDQQCQPKTVELTLGRLGIWKLCKREWSEQRYTLKPETWTANPCGAMIWASVTPVVLDRFPKSDRLKNRAVWNEEVAEIVKKACVRIGLPEPGQMDFDTTSWHRGVPRAVGKRRRLRSEAVRTSQADAALGDGFPPVPAKGTSASRPQVHIWLRFDQPVVGPLLLGAGRYRGYGLCRPYGERKEAVHA